MGINYVHILVWIKLDMDRHGKYDLNMGELWDNEFEKPELFFKGDGLASIDCG